MNINIAKSFQRHPFHLVDPSPWPFVASLAALACTVNGVLYMHAFVIGKMMLNISFIILLSVMFLWWRDVIREANFEGHHTGIVQKGLRYGVLLFIVSEIFFL